MSLSQRRHRLGTTLRAPRQWSPLLPVLGGIACTTAGFLLGGWIVDESPTTPSLKA